MTDSASQNQADVLVIFGITADLARAMTFHSLYRLEARGLLDCPIIGVAAGGGSVQELRKYAVESIDAAGQEIDNDVLDRLCARLTYLPADLTEPQSYQQLARLLDS